ncbi:unnamed protein product [Brassicogethes aeneus]|uniref:Homeobox domain-containing protein n=1 Tax=Brassicogethes aeneus TaxID=1431903 RepID=A0A9P0AVW0_BRAAE|nr:unnamed protein product [Brassicogethes aeneus]
MEQPNPLQVHQKLPRFSVDILRIWLSEHVHHAFPTAAQKLTLSQEANLTVLQVDNWFVNARRRILPEMISRKAKDYAVYRRCQLDVANSGEVENLELNVFFGDN